VDTELAQSQKDEAEYATAAPPNFSRRGGL
jgi:hypothetical protein